MGQGASVKLTDLKKDKEGKVRKAFQSITKESKINYAYGGIVVVFTIIIILMAFLQIDDIKIEMINQKKNVYQILGAYKEGICGEEIASKILKGNNIEKEEYNEQIDNGKRALLPYGYTDKYKTIIDKRYQSYLIRTICIYAVIYIFGLLGIYAIIELTNRKKKIELEGIYKILLKFQNKDYELDLTTTNEDMLSKINYKLEALGKQLLLNERQLSKEKEDTKALVTDISHQLKTPIASLKMCLWLLNDDKLEPTEKEEFMKRFEEQLDRLEGLTAALVNISRLEIGMISITKEENNIFDTIVTAINSVYLKADEKKIKFEIEYENSKENQIENLIIPHDNKWTKEAIVNVLENAIKYSNHETTITIRFAKRTSFIRIEIEDEGIGIPKDETLLIFKRFYRGKSKIVKESEGSGVGLYLTREILERQGGNITVTSKRVDGNKLKGSIFVIHLYYK